MAKKTKTTKTVTADAQIDTMAPSTVEPAETLAQEMATLSADEHEALAILEATDAAVLEGEAEAIVTVDTPQATDAPSFDQVLAKVDIADVEDTLHGSVIAFDERALFEAAKNGDNANIQKTLKSARSLICTKAAAAVMVATNVDPSVLNRERHSNSRYNVYAYGKLADLIKALNGGGIGNAINNAVLRSMVALKKGGHAFTTEVGKAAVSKQIHITGPVKNLLVRHTVAPSTASTQLSSTMQAAETLGIVKRIGSAKASTWEFADTPQARKIETMLAAA